MQEIPNLLFLLMKFNLEKIIEKFEKNFIKEDKEKNIFMVTPIIQEVFKAYIVPLFNKQSSLKSLKK
jgi:hypothetical protein